MADVTPIAGSARWDLAGHQWARTARFTGPADGDTWRTGLTRIDSVNVVFNDAATAAADAVAVTWSGGTVTFEVVGTARALSVVARGV